MNIFGVGLPEIAVISALALIIFGPKRLPELGRTLGKTLKGLQTASSEFEKEIQNAMNEDATLIEESQVELSNSSKPIEKNIPKSDNASNTFQG